ncbi:MAG: GPW/gp25 family protein [Polyangiaceae bacterium]|nr:GPW/gp25 family protein [Polyangiaceae bacterium]NUQ72702.1 GPW/gp25 family protein [Polyangiaceae bacterium]
MGLIDKLAGSIEERTLESIARNVQAVLNSKRGYGGVVEVYGLGAYDAHLATKPLIAALITEMTDAVVGFEPRLKNPRIHLLGRDPRLWAVFELNGTVDGEPKRFLIRFHTVYRGVEVEAVH